MRSRTRSDASRGAAFREVDAVDVDAELREQVHQRAGSAAQVEHLARLEDVSNQLGIAPFHAAPGFERVVVAFRAPLVAKIAGVVVVGRRRPLRVRGVFELRHGHLRCTSLDSFGTP